MAMFVSFVSFLFVVGVCFGQLPEFNVTQTDMERQMREFVVSESLNLLSNGTDVNIVAEKMVDILVTKYGKGWFSLVGSNTATNGLKTEMNTTLQFQYEDKHHNFTKVTISKQKVDQDSKLDNLQEIIKRAQNSTAIKIGYYPGIQFCDRVINETRLALSNINYDGCLVQTEFSDYHNSCAQTISDKIYGQLGTRSHITVGINSNFNSQFHDDNWCWFTLGDINFHIRILN